MNSKSRVILLMAAAIGMVGLTAYLLGSESTIEQIDRPMPPGHHGDDGDDDDGDGKRRIKDEKEDPRKRDGQWIH